VKFKSKTFLGVLLSGLAVSVRALFGEDVGDAIGTIIDALIPGGLGLALWGVRDKLERDAPGK